MEKFLNQELNLDVDLEQTLIAFSITLLGLLSLKLLIILTYSIFKARSKKNSIPSIILKRSQQVQLPMLIVISLYSGLVHSGIKISDGFLITIQTILLIYIFINIVNLVNKGIKDTTKELLENSANSSQKSVINYLSIVARTTVWILSTAVILENLGLDVSALVAGLGLSGFAIAFALRSLIKDLLASIVILLERPIKLGDRIVVAKRKGYVHKIGIKSTELIQEDGRIYIIPNSYITEKPVKNYRGDESEDATIEFEIKKNKLKVSASDLVRNLMEKNYLELIKEDFEIFLTSIGEESTTYQLYFSLQAGINKDTLTESIMNEIADTLRESKLKPLNIKFTIE